MSRPSDGMTMDELRDEFDWMYGFMGNMAERIRGDADVHNLVDYVRKLESESAKLRELVRGLHAAFVGMTNQYEGDEESLIWEYSGSIETDMGKLRSECDEVRHRFDVALRELGVEVDG